MKSLIAIAGVLAVIFLGNAVIMANNIVMNKEQLKNITPAEAKNRLDSGEKIILLDVRTPEEYRERHIPKSRLLPLDRLEKEAKTKLPDKEATILVYCRTGRRSAMAAEILAKLGYGKVYNLGGILDWPYETETGNGDGV